jgi:hypothetical protein
VNAFEPNPAYDGTPGQNLGNVGRNTLRAPGFFQWDFSAAKTFSVTEHLGVQFRADFFNILNHPNFGNPDMGICQSVVPADPSTNTPATCAAINTNFGKVGSTIAGTNSTLVGTGTARQEQFSLKVIF